MANRTPEPDEVVGLAMVGPAVGVAVGRRGVQRDRDGLVVAGRERGRTEDVGAGNVWIPEYPTWEVRTTQTTI